MKFILLNGPPGCGKDTAAAHLIPYLQFQHLKFAAPIKRMVAALLQCDMKTLEEIKDRPNGYLRFSGTAERDTPRRLLIELSEGFLKPRYGEDYFGNLLWSEASASSNSLFIVSDCGFESEVRRLITNAGRANCTLIRVHREGTNFDNDSRSYMPDGLCKTVDIPNNLTRHDLTMRVLSVIIRTWPEYRDKLLREPNWIKE